MPEESEDLLCPLSDFPFLLLEGLSLHQRPEHQLAGPAVLSHHDVLEDRHVGEQPHVLEGAGDAQRRHDAGIEADNRIALEKNFTLGGGHQAGNQVKEGGLAGAVGTDDADDLALINVEVEARQGV